ncbi:MAG: hypothetical protein SNH94_06585 [Rikenellaceae bacterium]
MKRVIYILISMLFLSCVKDFNEGGASSEQVDVPFSITFSAEEAFGSTRAELNDVYENEIINVWVLMFNGAGDRIEQSDYNYTDDEGVYHDYSKNTGKTAEDPIFGSIYIDDYKSQQIIYVDPSMTTEIVYIRVMANTFNIVDVTDDNTNFRVGYCDHIEQYNEKYFALTDNADRENDMWYEIDTDGDGQDEKYLRMAGNWGYVEGIDEVTGKITNVGESMPDEGLNFCLGVLAKPLAAKISITYNCNNYYVDTDAGEGVRITSVQVKRVPNKCYYKDVEDSASSHDYDESMYTTYQPRYSDIDDGLYDYTGTAEFYVPQNMRGYANNYEEGVTNLSASDKSNPANYPMYATCVVITGMYKAPFDSNSWASQEEQPIYIELYPGDDNNNYDVKLRRHYKITCNITPNVEGVSWDADYRITTEGDLPGAPIVHYEFNPDDHQYNSAYTLVTDEEGNESYELMNMNYPAASDSYVTNTQKQHTLTAAEDDYYAGHQQYYDPQYIFSGESQSLTGATTNIIAKEGKRFMRNLAQSRDEYNGYNGRTDSNGVPITHPEIFDCTYLKDHYTRYVSKGSQTHSDKTYYFSEEYMYSSGRLEYYAGNNLELHSYSSLRVGVAV